ncbi:MAG: hypothetical protein H7248_06325 [Microbacteriaceae bacterium]|nr:hypothetical protein [Microbacteriaceae bacterium]
MRGKLILVAGLATGYVLGSRAGRKRYDQIAASARKLWQSRSVQNQMHTVEDAARTQAPLVVDLLSVLLKRLIGSTPRRRNAAAFANDPSQGGRGNRDVGRGATRGATPSTSTAGKVPASESTDKDENPRSATDRSTSI